MELLYGFLFVLFLFFMKNNLTLARTLEASELIKNYCYHLIDTGKYMRGANYFELMTVSYTEFLFNPFAFTKYDAIKPEYQEALKKFEEAQ